MATLFSTAYPLYALGVLILLWACAPPAPTDVPGFIRQGDKYLEAGAINQAIASYRQALHLDSLDAVVLIRLGKVYQQQEKHHAADLYLRRGLDIAYQEGLARYEAGNLEGARLAFEGLLEQFSQHPMSLEKLGEISLAEGLPQEALKHFEATTEVNPNYTPVWVKLGNLYVSLDRPQDARKAFERAIAININTIDAYVGLGKIFAREENWPAAVKQFETALLIRPKSTKIRIALQNAKNHL